jgi:hypothetical protein
LLNPIGSPMHKLSTEQLIEQAAELATRAGNSMSTSVSDVQSRACLDIAEIRLIQADQALRTKQIELSTKANELSSTLLESNRIACEQSEKNAEQMNKATIQLAKSTESLNRATWVLVGVTFVQAVIALFAFLRQH